MKMSKRVGAVVAAGAVGIVGLVVPIAQPASALTSSVACAKVSSPPYKGGKITSTFASCTPAALKAGGVSTVAVAKTGPAKGKLVATIVWKNGKGTTKSSYLVANNGTGKCPSGTKRIKVTGKVLSATGAAKSITKVGEPVLGSVCSYTSGPNLGKTTIEPGTKFKL